jgi:hypothetical protein
MSVDGKSFLGRWHKVVADKNVAGLGELLAADVTLGPPPYWMRVEGHEVVHHLLGLIINTIDGFTYHRQWCDGAELALEFTGRVGDIELQGVDLISLDGEGRICRLDVVLRPANAIEALAEIIRPQMMAFLTH